MVVLENHIFSYLENLDFECQYHLFYSSADASVSGKLANQQLACITWSGLSSHTLDITGQDAGAAQNVGLALE